jgi:hypothetical protein
MIAAVLDNQGFAAVNTTASFDAYGVASGAVGPGTLTYEILVNGPCESESTCGGGGSYFPNVVGPTSLVMTTCPVWTVTTECFQGVVDFTFGVPFPFSFGINLDQSYFGYAPIVTVDSYQSLEFLSMDVSGTDTSVEFSLVPETGSFQLALIALLAMIAAGFSFAGRLYEAKLPNAIWIAK